MIEGTTPFLERAHKVALALGVASLLFGLVWGVVADDVDYVTTNGANGYSRSALGFQALSELLAARGIPVVRSRFRSNDRASSTDVLVVAAPNFEGEDAHRQEIFDQVLSGNHRVLFVLPKWEPAGMAGGSDEARVESVSRVTDQRITQLLRPFDETAELVNLDAPLLPLNVFGATPEIDHPQLLKESQLLPLVGGDDGLLIGEQSHEKLRLHGPRAHDEGRLVILSDPDLLSNSGLGRGENAALALAVIESLRGEGGSVVFDETLHGLERIPSVWSELFRQPLKLGSAHVVLLFGVALLAGALRFGRPRPLRGGWREGKEALLDNIAELMARVGHARFAVGRYFDATVERLAEYFHAPRALERSARVEWLAGRLAPARAEELRQLAQSAASPASGPDAAVSRRSEHAALLALAARIHRFREEVVHGAH